MMWLFILHMGVCVCVFCTFLSAWEFSLWEMLVSLRKAIFDRAVLPQPATSYTALVDFLENYDRKLLFHRCGGISALLQHTGPWFWPRSDFWHHPLPPSSHISMCQRKNKDKNKLSVNSFFFLMTQSSGRLASVNRGCLERKQMKQKKE